MKSAFLAIALVAAVSTAAAAENRFQVEPTRVDLSATAAASAVVVTNHGANPLRLSLSASKWTDDLDGGQQLAPTTDIVLRPALVEIAPGKSRTIRIGTTATTQAVEGTYRVFIEEMPDRRPVQGAQIQVLTRIGVPVFVAPKTASIQLVSTAHTDGSKGTITVSNSGTRHVKLAKISLAAVRGKQRRWVHEMVGWYVLAGNTRRFPLDLQKDAVASDDRLIVELTDEDGQVTTSEAAPR